MSHIAQQWQSYLLMAFSSVAVVTCGWLAGYLFNSYYPLPALVVDMSEFLGYILWGTGMAKPKINHLTNCIPSKTLNRRLQLFCSEVGIFAFVFARTLVPATLAL
jgi:hypothetical protein